MPEAEPSEGKLHCCRSMTEKLWYDPSDECPIYYSEEERVRAGRSKGPSVARTTFHSRWEFEINQPTHFCLLLPDVQSPERQ
jgi:hypothetical protein